MNSDNLNKITSSNNIFFKFKKNTKKLITI